MGLRKIEARDYLIDTLKRALEDIQWTRSMRSRGMSGRNNEREPVLLRGADLNGLEGRVREVLLALEDSEGVREAKALLERRAESSGV